jgi:type I restriction-modification system DNA methylase subunit
MKNKSIKNIRQEFKNQGIFYTPKALAEKLKSYVDIKPRDVYDPTCGAGNLLSAFPDEIPKYGQELDEIQLNEIELPNFTGCAGDTLTDDGFKGKQFHCIVANPPFSVKWNPDEAANDERFKDAPALPPPSKADWAFMLHILHHLADDGIAVILEFPGILYRGQREYKVRRWFCENGYIERVVEIEGGTFEDTAIGMCLIVMKKNRTSRTIVFERKEQIRAVEYDEIKKNDFTLSPSQYIEDEVTKEPIDPVCLERDARRNFLTKLKKELDFESIVCRMEGISIKPFLDAIICITRKYYKEDEANAGDV